jgi:hypothetical protein
MRMAYSMISGALGERGACRKGAMVVAGLAMMLAAASPALADSVVAWGRNSEGQTTGCKRRCPDEPPCSGWR